MRIVGVTTDWALRPTLEFQKDDGTRGWVLPWRLLEFFGYAAEYFPGGPGSWPVDPDTGERLPRSA